jgi:hypothetical protein
MNAYELMDLAVGIGNRIDVQLGIFITVHLAIFGSIIYVERPLTRTEKVASLFIYSLFAYLNYRIMDNQLTLHLQISTEVAKLADDACCSTNALVNYIKNDVELGGFGTRFVMLYFGHVVFYVVVLLSVIFDETVTKIVRTGEAAA